MIDDLTLVGSKERIKEKLEDWKKCNVTELSVAIPLDIETIKFIKSCLSMSDLNPEDINVSTWKIPSPLGIIGSHADGEFNGMTASWITQVSMEPALIGVGIDNKSVTFKLMNQSEYFTLNMFSPDYTKVFVKFSKPAEYTEGFLNKEPIFLTKNNVPIFQNATVWFELKTTQKIDFGTHTFFLGEIIDCKTLNPEDRVAYMGDTRMKYGGVPRGGH